MEDNPSDQPAQNAVVVSATPDDPATCDEPSPLLDDSQNECIRLARADWQANMTSPPAPAVAKSQDPTVAVPKFNGCGGGQRTETLESRNDFVIKLEVEERQPWAATASAKTPGCDETPPGAVSVVVGGSNNGANDSPIIQPLLPVPRSSFHGRPESPRPQSSNPPEPPPPLLEATLVVENHPNAPREGEGGDEEDRPTLHKVVVLAEELVCGFAPRQLWVLGGCLGVTVVAIVTAATLLVLGSSDSSSTGPPLSLVATSSPTPTPLPTLEQIRNRGAIRCGVWKESLKFFNFANIYDSQDDQVDFVLCRAYAAAILGDATKHEIVLTSQSAENNNLQELALGNIDILLSHVQTCMQADIWEDELGIHQGFTFSVPYLYTDFVYGGLREYVACADDNMNARGNCSGLLICTNDNSVYFDRIASSVPESHLVKRNDTLDIFLGFVTGACNIFPSENNGMTELGLQILSYQGDYVRGTVPFVKDVVTVATRDDDVEFSDFVNLMLLGLMAAEEANITRESAERMKESPVLGKELAMAVAAVGNYKDVYQQGVAPVVKRTVWNYLNNGTTGLMYTLPLGKLRIEGAGRVPGGTLERIWQRKDRKLHCGIRPNRPGFAALDDTGILVGMDVEYCEALAASALEGEAQSVNFVLVDDEADGYRKLQAGEVDVLAGFEWNVVNDYREPTTNVGYSFSQPYFYRPSEDPGTNSSNISSWTEEENLCLVTRQDDVQFSSFVYWTVAATVWASEEGISSATANHMPEVNLFGDDYTKMFRDAIYFVGSYDEIYERNLGGLLSKRGRNAVNRIRDHGPQLYMPPGFF